MLADMAATLQYAKQFGWSKITGNKTSQFRQIPSSASDEDERGSSEGLLEKGSTEEPIPSPPKSPWREPAFLFCHGALFAFYLLVLGLVAATKRPACHGTPYCTSSCPSCSKRLGRRAKRKLTLRLVAPAAKIIEYHDTKFTLEDHIQDLSIYSGAPSPELDQAWHDLLNSTSNDILDTQKKNQHSC